MNRRPFCLTAVIFFALTAAGPALERSLRGAALPWLKIPAGADAPSWKDDRPRHLAWVRRVMVEPFIARTKAAPWHAEALRFVEAVIPLWVDEADDRCMRCLDDEGRGFTETAEKLLAAGCADPLVLYFGGHAASAGLDDFERARTLYRALWPALEADTSPAGFRRLVAIEYAELHRGAGRKFEEQDEAALAWTRAALSDGSYGPEDGEVLIQHFMDGCSDAFTRRHADKIAALLDGAKVPAWARDTALGGAQIGRAWNARGSGWASTVKPEGWEGFAEHLALARKALTRAWRTRPDRPEAAAAMITVTMGEGGSPETIAEWFQRAVKARFDYDGTYCRLIQPLRPRWGGSHEAMLALARACAATGRFDTQVPLFAPQVLATIEEDLTDWRELYQEPDVAAMLMAVSAGVAAEPGRERERRSRQSFAAVNGWMTGEYALAAKAVHAAGPKLGACARAKMHKHYGDAEADFASEVRILAGEHRALFEKAEAAYSDHDGKTARALYEQLVREAGAIAQPRVRSRLLALAFEEKLAGGDWVAVPIDNDLAGWQPVLGSWSAEEGQLVLRGAGNRAWISFAGRAGDNVELRAEIAVEAPEKADVGLDFTFGVSMPVVDSAWGAARLYRGKEKPGVLHASFGDRFYSIKDSPTHETAYRGQHRLEARWENGRISGKLDGESFGENVIIAPPSNSAGFGEKIGLACFDIDRGVTVRISNLAARQLGK